MKVLIAFGTRHGCTQKCAEELAKKISGSVDVVNLVKAKAPELADYDVVIVGGSVYIGNVQKEVKKFCEDHLQELMNKKVGLFLCCANKEQLQPQFELAFPAELRQKAVIVEHFGHEVDMKRLGFMERTIMKVVAKTKESQFCIDNDRISGFALKLAE